jgi:hypothetical protein
VYSQLNHPLIDVSRYPEASPLNCALYLIGTGRVWEKRGVLPEIFGIVIWLFMEPHGQSPWYLSEIPAYAKASAGYPPAAKSARAAKPPLMIDSTTIYAFIHGQRPWSSA